MHCNIALEVPDWPAALAARPPSASSRCWVLSSRAARLVAAIRMLSCSFLSSGSDDSSSSATHGAHSCCAVNSLNPPKQQMAA